MLSKITAMMRERLRGMRREKDKRERKVRGRKRERENNKILLFSVTNVRAWERQTMGAENRVRKVKEDFLEKAAFK